MMPGVSVHSGQHLARCWGGRLGTLIT